MENINVKFDSQVLEQNRQLLGTIGSSFGKQFYRTNQYILDEKYDIAAMTAVQNGNKVLTMNRSPRRYKIDAYDIHSISYKNAGNGLPCVFLNEGDTITGANGESIDASARIVVGMNNSYFSETTEDNIEKALKGDRNIVFADPDSAVDKLNAYNDMEIAQIDATIEKLKKWKQSLEQTKENNIKRVQKFKAELTASGTRGAATTIIGHVEQ